MPPLVVLVVLVHGSLDRAASFRRVERRLQEAGCRTLAYDRRGYGAARGLSTPFEGPVFELHVADLVERLDAARGARTIVVGHSYGGLVALGAAARAPEQTVAVVAYEPPLPWLPWWPHRGGREALLREDPGAFAERFFRRQAGDAAWARLSGSGRARVYHDAPALVAELADLRRGEPLVDPARVSVPVVVGRGERSEPHQRQGAAWLASVLPQARLVEIPGARHGAHLSHPDAFARLVFAAMELADDADVR
jgi:pimeloyl-ACP methyl ester carboxylesterase